MVVEVPGAIWLWYSCLYVQNTPTPRLLSYKWACYSVGVGVLYINYSVGVVYTKRQVEVNNIILLVEEREVTKWKKCYSDLMLTSQIIGCLCAQVVLLNITMPTVNAPIILLTFVLCLCKCHKHLYFRIFDCHINCRLL